MDTNTVQFRVSKYILSMLEEELNPNPDQGILELVKNSNDTDSINCMVELSDTCMSGGIIHIFDDGDGMVFKGIENRWLQIGESPEIVRGISSLGRIPAGSNGLGRLAGQRMEKIIQSNYSHYSSRFRKLINSC